ncbi:MAG: sigma-70 family RNA polymerase sigma factor [Chloroflexi bacterium]|jgi:RNA polymerase sigma-70 factor (ECF subfamily)|nr:sigma-70 family RNA polymerase sigma factor [Anaerolineaceae bacterium]NMB90082.1 sigma-70 family RNA polymerase sigma factor [Chloroflexota bacterium]
MIPTLSQAHLPPDEEARLLSRAAGDANAFGQLYQAYVKPVYRYLYARVGNPMDAEDLTAQVFTQAFEGMAGYRHEGHFLAWLMAIARNRAIDFFRRRRPLVSLETFEALLSTASPDRLDSERADRLRLLAAAIQDLDDDDKELLRLRYAAGMPFQEIALLMHGQEAAIKKRLYRLLERIKHTLEGEIYAQR